MQYRVLWVRTFLGDIVLGWTWIRRCFRDWIREARSHADNDVAFARERNRRANPQLRWIFGSDKDDL